MGKRKRHKRLFPKKYQSNIVKVHGKIDQSKIISYEIFQNRPRNDSLAGKPVEYLECINKKGEKFFSRVPVGKVLRRVFDVEVEPIPHTVGIVNPDRVDAYKQRNTKAVVADRWHIEAAQDVLIWQNVRRQGVEKLNIIKLSDYKGVVIELQFTGNKWRIVQRTTLKICYSRIYESRDRALKAWYTDTICWSEITDIPVRE